MKDGHDDRVRAQFDPRANAYLASAVHAAGADLDAMAAALSRRKVGSVLDAGCGGGHVTFRLAPLAERVVACDLSSSMLETVAGEAARRGLSHVETRQASVEALPFAEGSFDVVATRFSAHHWRDLGAGLAEMRRVLKPGGIALFADVVAPDEPLFDTWLQSLELLRDPSHVRNRSVAEWNALLDKAGFGPGEVTSYRLPLAFGPWIERMRTVEDHVRAIRSLQDQATAEVKDYFALEADGSFTLDTALIVREGHVNR